MLDESKVNRPRATRVVRADINARGTAGAQDIVVTIEPLPAREKLARQWRDLEARANGAFFTSWAWVSAWLSTTQDASYALLSGRSGDRLVALAIVGHARAQGFGAIFGERIVALLQRGDGKDDTLFIEYNDILADRDCTRAARAALLHFIAASPLMRTGPWGWDECRLAGLTADAAQAVRDLSLPIEEHVRECAWVDFTRAGRWVSREDYLAALSRNTRAQVRRAIRIAEASGPLSVSVASGREERAAWLGELRALHQDAWQRLRKQPGAFASPLFAAFAETLVDAGADDEGSVQLLRIAAGPNTVGVLLNFVFRGHVYAYQSGFAYRDDNRFKPGLISHALAIVHNARMGCRGYHFMAGESRYKNSLATSRETLTWTSLRRRGAATAILQGVKAIKTRVRAIL